MHHQRSALAATTTAIIGYPSAGMNVRCSASGSTTQPGQQQEVQRDHDREVAGARLHPAPSQARVRVPGGDDELADPLDADDGEQRVVDDHQRLTIAAGAARR